MKVKTIIKKFVNGYGIERIIDNCVTEIYVIEEDESLDSGKDAFARLCLKLAEIEGFTYNKYGEDNIQVTFNKKGHKLE